jgi:Cohesin domain
VRKALLLGVIAAGAAAVAAQWLPTAPSLSSSTSSDTPAPAAHSRGEDAAPEKGLAALPARRPIGALRGELFAVPPLPQPRVPVAAPEAPAKPVAPAMPYRVAGTVVHDGVSKVVLMKGDSVVTVEAGETLEGGYRVESIGRDEIVMLYVPLGLRERLPVISTIGVDVEPETPLARAASPLTQTASAGTSARPAQLRWEGPERVQAGNTFTVALRITSEEPLRASPLQVSYDAKLLEAVGVRPGKFFGDGNFAYRVNPQGSIVVGASGPGSVAADAELLVLTFKPIRPAASTEVKISSLELQGQVGKPIAVEPIGAYRTSITP